MTSTETFHYIGESRVGILAWALGTAFGWMGVEALPGSSALTTTLTIAFSGIAAALLSNWPKIIRAKSDARGSESDRWQKETAQAIERIHASYSVEKTNHVAELRTMRLNSQRYQQIIGLERKAKHDVVGEWDAAKLHITELREMLIRSGETDVPSITPKNYRDVVGPYDEKIAEILALLPTEVGDELKK